MKESYVEGLASYGGPESCVYIRKGVGEALTGGNAGRVLSRVIHAPWRKPRVVRGAEVVGESRRPHRVCRIDEAGMHPARSETPCMRGHISRGNREISGPSATSDAERLGKPEGARR